MAFDANGNLVSLTETGQTTTYTWNARDQLASLTGPGLSGSFAYDAAGRRAQKTVAALTTTFEYEGLDIVRETPGGSEVGYLRGLGIDEPLARTESGGTSSYIGDALGNTVALTDAAGAVATTYTYDPFGQTGSGGAASANPLQFTARENDGTGVYFYRRRYYAPALHRFLSEDPLGLLSGPNGYAYVGNNPIRFVDPLGSDALVRWHRGQAGNPFGHASIGIIPSGASSGGDWPTYGLTTPFPVGKGGVLRGVDAGIWSQQQSGRVEYEVIIPTTSAQDQAIWKYIQERLGWTEMRLKNRELNEEQRRALRWTMLGNNCSTFVEGALEKGGIALRGPAITLPESLIRELLRVPGAQGIDYTFQPQFVAHPGD